MSQVLATTAAPRLVLRGTVPVPAQLVFQAAATLLAAAEFMTVVDEDDTASDTIEQIDSLGFELCETLLNPEDGLDGLRDPVAVEAQAHGCEIVVGWLRAIAQSQDNRITGDSLTRKGLSEKAARFKARAADVRAAGHAMGSIAVAPLGTLPGEHD